MRKLGVGFIATLLTALVLAAPASASFAVVVEVANRAYSPYGGPATATFTFAPTDPATIFTLRLREPGHGTIREKDVLVDPAATSSPSSVPFSWPKISVSSATDYVVDVRRQDGGPAITSDVFTLLPPLVWKVSASPSPFYPVILDGYRDRTKIDFTLAADATDVTVQVLRNDGFGRCCGAVVRTADLGGRARGPHAWSWDGRRGDGSSAPTGAYFARVAATDSDAVAGVSRPARLEIATGIVRMTAVRHKVGSAYARVSDERKTAIGGDCRVTRSRAAKASNILCANADITVGWGWALGDGARIESGRFTIDGGSYGCHKTVGHTTTTSFVRVHAPPTSTCSVREATISYSYPVRA